MRRTLGDVRRVALTVPALGGEPGRMEAGRIEFIHRSWPADSAQLAGIRHELAGWLAPLCLTDQEIADVVLAVDEAAVNAVRHAYAPEESGSVELTLWPSRDPESTTQPCRSRSSTMGTGDSPNRRSAIGGASR